jgi:capsule polysaccharide export protein KpsE/RkpR
MVVAAATLEEELTAARSELEGLRQIYADTNVRVRSAQARVAELDSELKKVGGANDSTSLDKAPQGNSLYPSIRELPLLGVPYADLYRKIRVQEAVFEMLTQKYELAKIQEAKETPSVKVLDSPIVPERKSFPPRTLITLFGTALALACGAAWVLGRTRWEQTEPADPGKALAQEIFDTLKVAMPWASRNGHRLRTGNPRTGGSIDPPDLEKEIGK